MLARRSMCSARIWRKARRDIRGVRPHVAVGVLLFGACGRDRLITMPWGVDVAQRGTHYLGASCRRSGIFQSRRLCRCALRTSHLMTMPERVMEAARAQLTKSQTDKAQIARTQHR